MVVLQFPASEFHLRGVYEFKISQVQHFTSVVHNPNWSLLNINNLNPTGHCIYRQFNIEQLYALPTLYLCFLYLSENKQRLVPLTSSTDCI